MIYLANKTLLPALNGRRSRPLRTAQNTSRKCTTIYSFRPNKRTIFQEIYALVMKRQMKITTIQTTMTGVHGSLMRRSRGISTARELTRSNVLAGELLKVLLREHTGVWLRRNSGNLMLTEEYGGARIRMESQESRSFFLKQRVV